MLPQAREEERAPAIGNRARGRHRQAARQKTGDRKAQGRGQEDRNQGQGNEKSHPANELTVVF